MWWKPAPIGGKLYDMKTTNDSASPVGDQSPEAVARRIPADQLNPNTPEAHQASEHAAKANTADASTPEKAPEKAPENETDEQRTARLARESGSKDDPTANRSGGLPLRTT